ncbi:MAG: GIY-YIG nuclease family protein [Lachnospiraceae bacterium]|nr:GIY-YIG nuclease family protein [Lachnospiraceae bacterium]
MDERTDRTSGVTAYTYILECADGTLYTGWTNDLEKRVKDHNTPGKGARYTRGRMPCRLVYYEEFPDKESAMRREWEIKHRLTPREKRALVASSAAVLRRQDAE